MQLSVPQIDDVELTSHTQFNSHRHPYSHLHNSYVILMITPGFLGPRDAVKMQCGGLSKRLYMELNQAATLTKFKHGVTFTLPPSTTPTNKYGKRPTAS